MTNKIKKAQVVIAAFDSKSQSFKFLLLQTNERRGSFWQNVTGKLEDDETFEEGALREASEETQFNHEDIIDVMSLGLTFDFVDQRERKVSEQCFLLIFQHEWDVKIDPHEHQAWKWVAMNDIHRDSVKFSSNYECLEKAQKLLKSRSF